MRSNVVHTLTTENLSRIGRVDNGSLVLLEIRDEGLVDGSRVALTVTTTVTPRGLLPHRDLDVGAPGSRRVDPTFTENRVVPHPVAPVSTASSTRGRPEPRTAVSEGVGSSSSRRRAPRRSRGVVRRTSHFPSVRGLGVRDVGGPAGVRVSEAFHPLHRVVPTVPRPRRPEPDRVSHRVRTLPTRLRSPGGPSHHPPRTD